MDRAGSWASTLRYSEKEKRFYLANGLFQRYRPSDDVSTVTELVWGRDDVLTGVAFGDVSPLVEIDVYISRSVSFLVGSMFGLTIYGIRTYGQIPSFLTILVLTKT